MTFQLDTTGIVLARAEGLKDQHPHAGCNVVWSDLDAFTQGYVEAMLRDTPAVGPLNDLRWPAFSDLAPEALARIIADCAAYQRTHADMIGISLHPEGLPRLGRLFWINRQNGSVASKPPLTVQLGDDGKVRFA